MKSLITYAFLALYVLWTLVSCSTVTPPEWTGPNPLDTPETFDSPPPSHGNFGPGWLYR